MPIFEVTAPDGKVIEVTAPDGATEDQAIAYAQQQYKPEQIKPDTGFTGAAKNATENLKADMYALAGRTGIMEAGAAEREAKMHKARAEKVFTPTQKEWSEDPFEKIKELAGGSAPYMAAPMVAGAATMLLPEAALAGGLLTAADLAAGAVGVAQFTGSNLSRQMDTGKHLEETNLLAAGASAVPQAALDVFGLRMIPGIRKIFGEAGVKIGDKAAEEVAKTGLMATVGSYLKQGVKTAGAEGLTEAGQQVFERLQAGLDIKDAEARKEYFENFIGGAALGGILAMPGHAMERMGQRPGQPPEQPPEAQTPIAPTANLGVENPVTMAGVGETPQVPRTQFAAPIVQPTAPVVETPTAAAPVETPAAPTGQPGVEQNRDRSAVASIAQMNKIAANPIYEFVGVDPKMTSGAPIVTGPVKIPENQLGKKSTAIAENGTKIPVQYAVVDAGTVLPSHNVDGTANAGYTPEHEGLRSVVGNGRTAGLQASYARGLAGNYREQLTADNTHGVPKSVIEGMENPMLVRFTPQSEVPANIGDISNVAGTMSLSTLDQAKNDANRVDLNALKFGDDGQVTRDTIRGFVQGMPTTEQAQLIDSNGNTTRQAHDRLNAAIFHLAYNNDALTHLAHEAGDTESQNIIRAMSSSAPQMAQLANAGEYDIRPAVVDAAQTAINARRQGHKLSDYVKQLDISTDPLSAKILQLFADNPRSPNTVAASLQSLAQKIQEETSAPVEDMFGARPRRSLNQIIDEHFQTGTPAAAPASTPAAKVFPNEKRGYQIDKPKDQIHAEVSKIKNHVDLAKWAVDNAPNRFAKAIAEKVLKRLKEFQALGIPMTVRVQNGTRRPTTRFGRSVWTIDKGGKTLHLDLSGTNTQGKTDEHSGTRYSTILHELLHSVTQAQLHMLGPAATQRKHPVSDIYRDLSNILDALKKEARRRGIREYDIEKGLKNVDELVAHGLTNDTFQDFMSSVKMGEKTAMTKLVEIIRDILGLSPDYDSALDQLVRVTERAFVPSAAEVETQIQKVTPNYQFRKALPAPEAAPLSGANEEGFAPLMDESGKPVVVYRGSLGGPKATLNAGNFFGTGMFGKGINLTSSPADASKYASTDVGENVDLVGRAEAMAKALGISYNEAKAELTKAGGAVYPLNVSLQNPLVIGKDKINVPDGMLRLALAESDFKGGAEAVDRFIRQFNRAPDGVAQFEVAVRNRATPVYRQIATLQNKDGLIIKPELAPRGNGATHYLVFDESQVRSVFEPSERIGGAANESFVPDYDIREGSKFFKAQSIEDRRKGYANSFKNPITLRDGTRLSGFTDPAKQTTFHGYDKNGNRITMRRELVNPDDIVFSKDGNKTADYFKDKLLGLEEAPPIQISNQEEHNVERLTKTMPVKTQGQQVRQAATAAWNNIQDNQYRTSLRVAWVDKNSGLTKSLESQPTFDVHGRLRADMLARTQDQMINLVNNGLQSGTPVINSDGTLGIERSENNLARSQIVADSLDGKIKMNGKALSGRDAVAEVARALRGKDILIEDAKRRALGERQMQFAKELVKLLKVAREKSNLNPETGKPYTIRELQQILNGVKYLRREGRKNKAMRRELQVKPAHIEWAEAQLAAHPELQQVLDIWRNVNNSLVTLWENAGLFTKEQADDYRSRENYVPLFKSREDLENDPNGYGGTGAKTVKGVKQLHGSMATRNLWENVEKHYAAMVASAYQNQTRKVATGQLKALGLASIPEKANDPQVNLRYRDPTDPFADSKGIVSAIIHNPNDLAAFQMMHYELSPLMKMMSATTRVLRAGALVNPMYWIKQLVRDPVHATMVADSGIVTPFHAAKEYINILANNSEEAKILASRGVIGQIDSTIDLHDFLKQVGTAKSNPNLLDKMIHKVMKAHEASDAATRVAIYKKEYAAAKKRGMSEDQAVNFAVHKARESINFAVRGNSPTLNGLRHMVPFLSAAITSLDTVYRAATGYGKSAEEKAQAKKIFYSRALMMSVMATVYAMAYQDDDDYKKLPDYVKDNNWLIPNPFGEGHSFIKVATPFEVGFLFKTIPEAAVRYMRGTSTGREVLASYAHGLANNLPGGSIPPISVIPQAAKPIIEVVANYSFFTGRPIEGMGDLGLPVAARGERASELSKKLSAYGLDKLGLSPAKLDYLIQSYTAELGTFSVGMASDAIYAAEGKTRPNRNIEELPFNKSFMTNPNTSKAVADFYDLEHNAQEAVTQLNKLKATGMVEEAKSYASDEQVKHNIAAANVLRGVGAQLTQIRQAMNYYTNKQDMDPEVRRQKLNELEAKYHQAASQGYKIAASAGINR